jgi:hypothetical protein
MHNSSKISRVVGSATSKKTELPKISINQLIDKLTKAKNAFGEDFYVEFDIDKYRTHPVEVVMSGSFNAGITKIIVTNSKVK